MKVCAAHQVSRQLRVPPDVRDGTSIFNGSKMNKRAANRAVVGISSTERLRDSSFRFSSGKVSGRIKTT